MELVSIGQKTKTKKTKIDRNRTEKQNFHMLGDLVRGSNNSFIEARTIPQKIFGRNSSFYVKQRTTLKVKFPFSRSFVLVLTKFSFWKEDWALGNNSIKFKDFPDIS